MLIIFAPVANLCDGEYCYSTLLGGIPPFFKWDSICENFLLLPGVAPLVPTWIGDRFFKADMRLLVLGLAANPPSERQEDKLM